MPCLSVIGMSGTGKTYWSTKLEEAGYRAFHCDRLIADKLKKVLTRPDGTVMRMGEWMGLPSDSQYAECETKCLNVEIEVLEEIISCLEDSNERVVIDTTGSVIYTGDKILSQLKTRTKIIYLPTPEEVLSEMCKEYIKRPISVLWNGHFNQRSEETVTQALVRCYPELVASRTKSYYELADVTIDYWQRRKDDFTVTDFLRIATEDEQRI